MKISHTKKLFIIKHYKIDLIDIKMFRSNLKHYVYLIKTAFFQCT